MYRAVISALYVLTALINKPKRLIYLSSGMHRGGDSSLTGPGLEGAALEWLQRLCRHLMTRPRTRLLADRTPWSAGLRAHAPMTGREPV